MLLCVLGLVDADRLHPMPSAKLIYVLFFEKKKNEWETVTSEYEKSRKSMTMNAVARPTELENILQPKKSGVGVGSAHYVRNEGSETINLHHT